MYNPSSVHCVFNFYVITEGFIMKKSIKIVLGSILSAVFVSSVSYAEIPTPKSEGKYLYGLGTKSDELYEQAAGAPIYDYYGKGLQVGPVKLRPGAEYRLRAEDNVFYEEQGKKSDIVNTLYGTLRGELPLGGGQHLLTAGASVLREYFARFDRTNHTDYRLNGGLKLNFVPFTLDMEDVFEQTESRSNTEFSERTEREENAFHSLLEVPFASFFLENEITDFNVDYGLATNESFNHNLFTVYQRVGRELTPTSQLLFEYGFVNIDYTEVGDRDGIANQYMVGLRGNWSELVAYQAWVGAQHRIYDQDIRPDFNGVIFRGAIQYDRSELSRFVLKGDITPQESTFDGQSFYTRNSSELSWRRQIHERIYWNSVGTVAYNDYSRITKRASTSEEETRRDWIYEFGTGLEYRLPNDIVSVVLDYKFAGRESNLDGLDYDANSVSVGVRAYY